MFRILDLESQVIPTIEVPTTPSKESVALPQLLGGAETTASPRGGLAMAMAMAMAMASEVRGSNQGVSPGDVPWDYGQSLAPVSTADQYRPVPLPDGTLRVDPEIHLPSPGMNVDIAYFYNSNQPTYGPYGYGRTISLNLYARATRLAPDPDSSSEPPTLVEIARGNGTLVSYLQGDFGAFVPQTPMLFNKLERDEVDGLWIETTPDGRVSRYPLNLLGQACPIQSVTDSVGNQHTWHYEAGFLSALEDTVGRLVTLSYDPATALLQSIEDWAARVTTFSYDQGTAPGKSLLSSVMGPSGCITGYGYDSSGLLTGITDPNGHMTTYSYDSTGRINGRTVVGVGSWEYAYPTAQVVVSGPDGAIVTQTVGASASITDVQDAVGQATSLSYNARGMQTGRTYANGGGTYTTLYNNGGDFSGVFPLSVTDPLGHTTEYVRDTFGNPVSIIYADQSREDMLWALSTSTFDRTGEKRRLQKHIRYPLGADPAHDHIRIETLYGYNDRGQLTRVENGLHYVTSYSYDPVGNLKSVQNAEGYFTSYSYDLAGNVTKITDALGHVNTLTYDKQNRLTSSTDPLGHTTTWAYDGVGNLVLQMDALGHTDVFTYNAYDKVLTATDPNTHVTHYKYDAQGRLTEVTDPLTHITTTVYDDAGRISAIVDALGRRTTGLYDASGHPQVVIDALGHLTTMLYDNADRHTGSIDPLGYQTTTIYDSLNRPIATVDALNHHATMMYDGAGRITTLINALSQETVMVYDDANQLLSVTNPLYQRQSTTYDAIGRIKTITDPLGHTTTFNYDPIGRQTSIQNARGFTLTNLYDGANRLQAIQDPLGNFTTIIYDAVNRPIAHQDALGQLTTTVYDPAGQVTSLISPLNNVTHYGYDDAGRQISVTDANTHQTIMGYDDVGRMTTQQDARGYVTTLAYDELGRNTVVQDARGHCTTMNYDPRGLMLWSQDALGRFTTLTYDEVGNAKTRTDGRGLITTMSYDALNRLTTVLYDSGRLTAFGFDTAGRQIQMTDEIGVTFYDYDAAGRMQSVSYPITGTLTYLYDETNNRIGMLNPAGELTSYAYDSNNRLTWLKNPLAEVTTFVYDSLDREKERHFANGVLMQRSFDGDGRIVSLSYWSGTQNRLYHTLTYDPVGNLKIQQEQDGASTAFDYDNANQLQSEVRTGSGAYSRAYTYDGAGNRTLQNADGVLTTSLYDAANQLQNAQTGAVITTYVYDRAGNRQIENAGGVLTTYMWNEDDKLVGLSVPTGEFHSLQYAGDGDLRRQTVAVGGTPLSDVRLLKDGQVVLEELDTSSGEILRQYTNAGGRWGALISLHQEVDASGGGGLNVSSFNRRAFNQASVKLSSPSQFYAFDQIGTTRFLLDANGMVADSNLNTGFGKELISSGEVDNPFRFVGNWQYLRLETNLILAGARVYDSVNGVWLSPDPIGITGGIDLYSYVFNNSLNRIDPEGYAPTGRMVLKPDNRPIGLIVTEPLEGPVAWFVDRQVKLNTMYMNDYFRGYGPIDRGKYQGDFRIQVIKGATPEQLLAALRNPNVKAFSYIGDNAHPGLATGNMAFTTEYSKRDISNNEVGIGDIIKAMRNRPPLRYVILNMCTSNDKQMKDALVGKSGLYLSYTGNFSPVTGGPWIPIDKYQWGLFPGGGMAWQTNSIIFDKKTGRRIKVIPGKPDTYDEGAKMFLDGLTSLLKRNPKNDRESYD